MIITVRSEEESKLAIEMIKKAGYEFQMSYYYSQEWTNKKNVILLHKAECSRKAAVW